MAKRKKYASFWDNLFETKKKGRKKAKSTAGKKKHAKSKSKTKKYSKSR